MSRRLVLGVALIYFASALWLAALLPTWLAPTEAWHVAAYPFALAGWALVMGGPVAKAIKQPQPDIVQAAVKHCIFGLVGLDAVLAFGLIGGEGLAILLLLVPAVWLGKYVYST